MMDSDTEHNAQRMRNEPVMGADFLRFLCEAGLFPADRFEQVLSVTIDASPDRPVKIYCQYIVDKRLFPPELQADVAKRITGMDQDVR